MAAEAYTVNTEAAKLPDLVNVQLLLSCESGFTESSCIRSSDMRGSRCFVYQEKPSAKGMSIAEEE